MYLLQELDSQFQQLQKSAQAFADARTWLKENMHRFEHLPTAMIWNSGERVNIDFDRMSHSEVMKIVMAFGRPWKREANEDRINYIHDVSPTIRVRCFQGEPPPNCRVVYEEVEIPAQPAKMVRKAKIVCQSVNTAITEGATQLTQ